MSDRKETVSYIVFEGEMTRMERTNHRLWIFCILLLLTLIGTNAGWLYYESTYQYVESLEVTQDTEGGTNNFIGNDGDIYNGETESPQD